MNVLLPLFQVHTANETGQESCWWRKNSYRLKVKLIKSVIKKRLFQNLRMMFPKFRRSSWRISSVVTAIYTILTDWKRNINLS